MYSPLWATARLFLGSKLNTNTCSSVHHMCIYQYMQRRYINMVSYTCAFSFLFWCWFWIRFGSWEAIFCVVNPWWSYKALLTAMALEEKKEKTKLGLYTHGSSKKHLKLTPYSDETVWKWLHCWRTTRWLQKLTFSPRAWKEHKEWSSWATWSPLELRWLLPQLRLSWWSACCPPPSLQTLTTHHSTDHGDRKVLTRTI